MQRLILIACMCTTGFAMERGDQKDIIAYKNAPEQKKDSSSENPPDPEQLAVLAKKLDLLAQDVKKYNEDVLQAIFDMSLEKREAFRKNK